MQVGDLVKYRRCGTHGVITRTWEVAMPQISVAPGYEVELMLEVLWSDGIVSDTSCRRVEVVCK